MKQSQISQSKEKGINKMIIVISNKEYVIEMNEIIKSVFKITKETQNQSESANRITLPKSIDSIEVFRKYLTIVLSIRKKAKDCFYSEAFDVFELLKLIDISITLNDEEITNALIEDKLKPLLSKESCLMILSKYTTSLQPKKQLISIQSLINYCVHLSARKLNELMILSSRSRTYTNKAENDNEDKDELLSLPNTTLINIFTQYFKEHTHQGYDHTNIIQLLMKMRKILNNDIFTLLDEEKTHSINAFEKAINDNCLLSFSHFEWTLINCCFKADFYKESNIYFHDSYMVKFYCYYDYERDLYSVALQLVQDTVKPLKEENICVLTNCNINNINDNNSNSTSLNYIDSSSNAKKLILHLSNAALQLKPNASKVVLRANLSVDHILPAITHNISQKLYMYYMLPSITKLSTKSLLFILKRKCLYLRSEDEALFAILNWMKNKANPKEESLLSLFSIIKWKEISIDSLIELITSYSKLLIALPQLESLIKDEFHRRLREEYTNPESSSSFTNELIDKVMNKSLKNVQCFQQLNLIKKSLNNNNTDVFHTTDNTTLLSRNNISTNDYLNSCSHLEEIQSNSIIMKTNSSLVKKLQNNNNDSSNQSRRKTNPRTFVKSDISLLNANSKTESNESKNAFHAKNKSLSLELNVLTCNSCWVNTSISKRNETTQLKRQLDIIEKKINKAKQNKKQIRHNNTANKYANMAFKSAPLKQTKPNLFTPSSQTFSK